MLIGSCTGHCSQQPRTSQARGKLVCNNIVSIHRKILVFKLMQGIPRRQVAAQAAALLGRVRLTEAAGVRSGAYSGGMRRRLSVAIALLGDVLFSVFENSCVSQKLCFNLCHVSQKLCFNLCHLSYYVLNRVIGCRVQVLSCPGGMMAC